MTDPLRRILPLKGGCNFRDLGGYQTCDGRLIRTGVLFRSGVMSYFTPDDHADLIKLGIHTICDLRRAAERSKEPTRWPGDVLMLSWNEDAHIEAQSKQSWDNSVKMGDARNAMLTLYRGMPETLRAHMSGIFERIAGGGVPLVFHCAAGKDRTGFAAALLLHALGVDRETLLIDYELTNVATKLQGFVLTPQQATMGLADGKRELQTMNPVTQDAYLNANRDYLSAALEKIEEDHDSIDNYLRNVLNVSDSMKNKIRRALLTG